MRDEVEAAHAHEETLRSRSEWGSSRCLIWLGSTTAKGYGQIGRLGYMYRTHRLMWIVERGAIPEGMQVDHTCFNRACMNVAHLRLVTPKKNSENRAGANPNNRSTGVRGIQVVRSGRFACKFGHNLRQTYVGTFDSLEEAKAALEVARAAAYEGAAR